MASSLYESITIDDIVKEAGISKKTLYRHYESKDAIFDDVFHELFIRPTHKSRESFDVDRIYSMPTLILEQAYSVLYENRVPMESYYKSRGMAGWIDLHCRNLLASKPLHGLMGKSYIAIEIPDGDLSHLLAIHARESVTMPP